MFAKYLSVLKGSAVTMWRDKKLAVHRTPAYRMNISRAQVTPKVTAVIILKALETQKSLVA